MKFSVAMLKNISRQIEAGQALAGLATANRYLAKDCPLRKALALKAENRLKTDSPELRKVLAGEILNSTDFGRVLQENKFNASSRKISFVIPKRFEIQIERAKIARRVAGRERRVGC